MENRKKGKTERERGKREGDCSGEAGVSYSSCLWSQLTAQPHCVLQWGLPTWLRGKQSACNAGDMDSKPGPQRSCGEGNSNPLQCSCMEKILRTGKPGRLLSVWLQRVGHSWSDSALAYYSNASQWACFAWWLQDRQDPTVIFTKVSYLWAWFCNF